MARYNHVNKLIVSYETQTDRVLDVHSHDVLSIRIQIPNSGWVTCVVRLSSHLISFLTLCLSLTAESIGPVPMHLDIKAVELVAIWVVGKQTSKVGESSGPETVRIAPSHPGAHASVPASPSSCHRRSFSVCDTN